jgi:hypothetical protein
MRIKNLTSLVPELLARLQRRETAFLIGSAAASGLLAGGMNIPFRNTGEIRAEGHRRNPRGRSTGPA